MSIKRESEKNGESQVSSEAQLAVFSCLNVLYGQILNLKCYALSSRETRGTYLNEISLLICWFDFLLETAKASLSENQANQLVSLTSCLLELVVSDDIAKFRFDREALKKQDIDKNKSTYARQFFTPFSVGPLTVNTNSILTHSELAYIFEHPDKEDIRILSCEELLSGDIDQTCWRVYLAEEFSDVDSFLAFLAKYRQVPKQHKQAFFFAFARIRLTDHVGCIVSFGDNGEIIKVSSESYIRQGVIQLVSPVAKSQLWRAALSTKDQPVSSRGDTLSHVSLVQYFTNCFQYCLSSIPMSESERDQIDALNEQTKERHTLTPEKLLLWLVSSLEKIETWQRGLLYKKLIRVLRYDAANETDKQDYLSAIEQRHQEHFQQLLADPTIDALPSVLFTRSGISANGVALMAAKEILSASGMDQVSVHETPGWYFENQSPNLWQKVAPQTANVLLVNIEPNAPEWDQTTPEFFLKRDEEITEFLTQVGQNPQSRFVLIVDKTSDLLNHDYLSNGGIPENLTVFETASLTKHQRGGRLYFFGLLASWHNPLSADQMQKLVTIAMGELTPDSVFALSRIGAKEVNQQIGHNKLLSSEFARILDSLQTYLPRDERWQWQAYTYFGFLLPPKKTVVDHFAKLSLEKNSISRSLTNIELAVDAFLDDNKDLSTGFEKGDSFGLDMTRITPFRIDYENKITQPISTLRVGFGRKTSVEQMRHFAEYILSKIVNS